MVTGCCPPANGNVNDVSAPLTPIPHRTTTSRRVRIVAALTSAAFAVAACGSSSSSSGPATTAAATAGPTTTAAQGTDIVGTALLSGVFTELAGGVVSANLVDTLRSPGPFTVFAPTDAAFAKLPDAVLKAVQTNPALFKTVLTYHVVPGKLNVAALQPGKLTTVSGEDLTITKEGAVTYVNGNAIAKADAAASNGIIHVMGDVLVPPIGDIIKVATTLPGFTTLAKLVTQADLVKTLQSAGPFTVFAPVDAAFAKLPAATVTAVTSDPKLLAKVLTYHVVAGKLSTSDLKEGKLKTVAGVDLTITKKDGQTFIDGKPIAVANVEATNGIIQVMGDVLVPAS